MRRSQLWRRSPYSVPAGSVDGDVPPTTVAAQRRRCHGVGATYPRAALRRRRCGTSPLTCHVPPSARCTSSGRGTRSGTARRPWQYGLCSPPSRAERSSSSPAPSASIRSAARVGLRQRERTAQLSCGAASRASIPTCMVRPCEGGRSADVHAVPVSLCSPKLLDSVANCSSRPTRFGSDCRGRPRAAPPPFAADSSGSESERE